MGYVLELEEELLMLLPGLISGIPSGLFGIAAYILTALAIYTISCRRGLRHPWLAWVPVANVWLLGSLSDQYQYVVKGENKSKRKWLITLNILKAVLWLLLIILTIVAAGMLIANESAQTIGLLVALLGLLLPFVAVIIAACVISAVAAEFLFDLAVGKKNTIGDFSAVVTGLLLALNLSTNVPVWQCVVGSVFAIVCVKGFFGGLGCNFANPAIAGRVFMLLTFSQVAGGANPTIVDVTTSATPLELLGKGEEVPSLLDMFLGLHGGAIGETCAAALLIGFVYLLVRKVITWHTPVVFVVTVFVCYLVATGFDVTAALYQVLAGGLMIGAIFMATDYVTTPINTKGRVVFALGCGVITFIIRFFCAYPEGVSFSILIMNILAPYIEKWTASEPLGGVK